MLNLIYDLKMVDLNEEKTNFPGLDIGDAKAKIAFKSLIGPTRSHDEDPFIVDGSKDIIYSADLIAAIKKLYHDDHARFLRIKALVEKVLPFPTNRITAERSSTWYLCWPLCKSN